MSSSSVSDADKSVVGFDRLVGGRTWESYAGYYDNAQTRIRAEIRQNAQAEREFRRVLRAELLKKYPRKFKRISTDEIKAATQTLRSDTCAVDGTLAKFDLMSGMRSQIGIVAVNYNNDKATYVTYVTEATYSQFRTTGDIIEALEKRDRKARAVSDLVLRATMAYWERRHAIAQPSTWKILHGELFPFELRNGLGELQALRPCLNLFREMARCGQIGSVVSDSTGKERIVGSALEEFEYFEISSLRHDYEQWLAHEAHFGKRDKKQFREFIVDTARDFVKGVYRVGPHPYVFYCKREFLHEFAALLMADSALVPERGFPMLVDYADSICASLFRAGDFERRIEHELAMTEEALTELSERWGRQH
jgi:hypothetical protein